MAEPSKSEPGRAASNNGREEPAGPPELVTERLEKSFGAHPVLRGIDLTIRAGDIVAIVGSSGCGKTVLLDHLTGLMDPDQGRVLVADHNRSGAPLVDLAALTAEELDDIRLHWSIVFQRNALFSGTVYENIALWLREHSALTEEQIRARAREALEAVALEVADVMEKDRDALSGGMAKRVAVARAIAIDPLVMFYDEPTTGLDPVVSAHVHELIWATHRRPMGHADQSRTGDVSRRTTVIITHDRELLRRIEPRVVMLDQGVVAFEGGYDEFRASELPAAKLYLQAMPVLHARPVS